MSTLTKLSAPVIGAAVAKQAVKASAPRIKEQVLDTARERVLPAIDSARERVGPAIDSAREQVGPALETAREQLRDTVAPAVGEAIDTALVRSAPARAEAKRRSALALTALMGRPLGSPRRRWPMALLALLVGFGTGAAVGWLTRPRTEPAGYQPPPPVAPPTAGTTDSVTAPLGRTQGSTS